MPTEVSRLMKVHPKYNSLRLNIPRRIVEELELKFQDLVVWEMSTRKGKKTACITKAPFGQG